MNTCNQNLEWPLDTQVDFNMRCVIERKYHKLLAFVKYSEIHWILGVDGPMRKYIVARGWYQLMSHTYYAEEYFVIGRCEWRMAFILCQIHWICFEIEMTMRTIDANEMYPVNKS